MELTAPSDNPQLNAAVQALQLRAWSHATTIRLAQIEADQETSFNTASGLLLEFGRRAVVATAWHVVEEYLRLRARKEVYIICDNMPFVEPRTAWRDESNDIVFLDVPRHGRRALGAVPYRPLPLLWPPPRVRADDSVLLCGFPKLLRSDGDEILHGDLNFLVDVASAGENYFMLQIEHERLIQGGRVLIPEGTTDFGGVSGGPVFLSDGGGNPLVGLVSQAGERLPLWRVSSLNNAPSDIESASSIPL